MTTMQCPHGSVACTTCQNSAAARELRDLRRVLSAATRLLEDPSSTTNLEALRAYVEMAAETSPKRSTT